MGTPFVLLSGEDAERVKKELGQQRAFTKTEALRRGDVVFVPGKSGTGYAGTYTQNLKRDGLRIVSRNGQHEGVDGLFMWAVPKEASK